MLDYAISAVGRNTGAKTLTSTRPGSEIVRFEDIAPDQGNAWDGIGAPENQFRIIPEPSSVDKLSMTAMNPWDTVTSRVVEGLDHFQRGWRASMKAPAFPDKAFAPEGNSDQASLLMSTFRSLEKFSFRMIGAQVRMTVVTSVASLLKNSVSMLYRQQG